MDMYFKQEMQSYKKQGCGKDLVFGVIIYEKAVLVNNVNDIYNKQCFTSIWH
jgi:hypothetical protein